MDWWEVQVGKSCSALAILVLLSASPAVGQYVPLIQACSRDIQASCPAAQAVGGLLAACIKANFPGFAEPCQAALVRVSAVREACRADVQKQCNTSKAGAGRVLLCVKQHFAALSEPCKDAIGRAAERKVGAR